MHCCVVELTGPTPAKAKAKGTFRYCPQKQAPSYMYDALIALVHIEQVAFSFVFNYSY
jgi:hypothetical protein